MAFITSWRIKDRQNFYMPILQPSSLIFDIGANHGEFTAAFLACGARKVIAVEPQMDVAATIKTSFPGEIAAGRVIVRTHAIGASSGIAKVYPAKDPGKSMSTLSTNFVEVTRAEGRVWNENEAFDTQVATLDSLIDECGLPDYVKIDVEGYDFEVLQGLSRPVKLLSFEYNSNEGLIQLGEQCIMRLTQLGNYEFNYQAEAPGQVGLQFQAWVGPEVMRYVLCYDIARAKVFGDIYARLK